MAGMVRVRILKRALIQRYGKAIITMSMADAAKLMERGDGEIVDTGFNNPPIHKMVTRPGVSKEVAQDENPTGDSHTPSGGLTMTIRRKK